MRKLLAALAVAIALTSPALAFARNPAADQTWQLAQSDNQFTSPAPSAAAPAPATTTPAVKVPTGGSVGSTEITTTAPVSSSTKISVGTLASEVLTWIAAAFATVLGTVLTGWIVKLMKIAGVEQTDLLKAQLQGVIVNGINAGAANISQRLKGQGEVAIKNAVVADAVAYAQTHASETIKALGLDPKSGRAVEAIKARIETALVDPAQATHPAVTPPSGMPPVAVVAAVPA